jgi:hypothetical protein
MDSLFNNRVNEENTEKTLQALLICVIGYESVSSEMSHFIRNLKNDNRWFSGLSILRELWNTFLRSLRFLDFSEMREKIEVLIIQPFSNRIFRSTGGGRWPSQKAPIG